MGSLGSWVSGLEGSQGSKLQTLDDVVAVECWLRLSNRRNRAGFLKYIGWFRIMLASKAGKICVEEGTLYILLHNRVSISG